MRGVGVMTIEEIRKNAPKGSTHWEYGSGGKYAMYWMQNSEGLFLWHSIYKKWQEMKFAKIENSQNIKPL